MNLVALRGATGVVILFLGRELSFLFAGAMAALIGTRILYLLPASWPSWSESAFLAASVLGAISIGLLGEWGMILISCLVGTYLIYGVLPLFGITRTLATAGVFIVGAVAQVIIFQMQKHSDR